MLNKYRRIHTTPAGEATASSAPKEQLFLSLIGTILPQKQQRAGIAPPPLPQPRLQRLSGFDGQFLWLHPLSSPHPTPNIEQINSCRTGDTSDTAHTGHMVPSPRHPCANMVQTGVCSLCLPGYLTSAPQATLLFSLVLASFHSSCGTGNSSELYSWPPWKGEGRTEGEGRIPWPGLVLHFEERKQVACFPGGLSGELGCQSAGGVSWVCL